MKFIIYLRPDLKSDSIMKKLHIIFWLQEISEFSKKKPSHFHLISIVMLSIIMRDKTNKKQHLCETTIRVLSSS